MACHEEITDTKAVVFSFTEPKEEALRGVVVTFCDGTLHRTRSNSDYDRLLKIEPCNGECALWKATKGREVSEYIPNLKVEWITSTEDMDEMNHFKRI